MSRSNRRRARANRQNAKTSTGPRTLEGKARSSMNALKHCLLAESVVIPDCAELETHDQFNQLLTDLSIELKPVGMIEEMLVEQIAVSYWRLRRVLRKEAGDIADRVEHHYQWNADNPIGHASLPDLDSAHLIIRYESTIERRMNRALYTLERLQSRRSEKASPVGQEPRAPDIPVGGRITQLLKRPPREWEAFLFWEWDPKKGG